MTYRDDATEAAPSGNMVRQPRDQHRLAGLSTARSSRPSFHLADATLAMILLIAGLVLLAHVPAQSLARVERMSSEGWNAYHVANLLQGRALYDSSDKLFINNYPPLSFVVTAPVGSLLGDHVFAGRLISALSFVFVLAATYAIALKLAGQRSAALVAPAYLLLFTANHGVNHLAVNDPQWLGHAFAVGALFVFVRDHSTWQRKLLVILLALLAMSTKLMYVPEVLAIVAWIALIEPRTLPIWILLSVAAGIAVLGLWLALFGLDMAAAIAGIEGSRDLDFRKVIRKLIDMLPVLVPAGLLTAVALLLDAPRRRGGLLAALFVAGAAALGVLFHAGEGVRTNAYLSLAIALSIGTALGLARLGSEAERWRWANPMRLACATALATTAVLSATIAVPDVARDLRGNQSREADLERIIRGVAAVEGGAFCQVLLVCYWAGKPDPIDAWSLEIMLRTGVVPVEAVASMVRNGRFAVVQVRAPGSVEDVGGAADGVGVHQFPDEINALWAEHYEVVLRNAEHVLLRRRLS